MIVVFGSMNIDMVMPVGGFPKPGETVLCTTDYLSRPGGKGANQAVAAARAGGKAAIIGMVGDDSFGRRSLNNLKHEGVWVSGVGTSERPTGCAMVAVDMQGKNFAIVAPGANLDARADQVPDEAFTPKNIVLTQLEVTAAEAFLILERARAQGSTTILNPSPVRNFAPGALKFVDYLILNEVEALQIAASLGVPGQDPVQIAKILAKAGNLSCIITLEARGAVAARGDDIYAIAALPIEVVDSTGAGDAFCGIFAACLQDGMDWLDALRHASVGAGLSCLGLGAQDGIPFMDDIKKNLDKIAPAQKS